MGEGGREKRIQPVYVGKAWQCWFCGTGSSGKCCLYGTVLIPRPIPVLIESGNEAVVLPLIVQ